MENENKYDKKYNDFISKAQIEGLKDEFTAKPFFEVWRMTYFTTLAFKTILQAISVMTFVCAVAYFTYLFAGSIVLGICFGVSLSVLIEYNKNKAYQNAFRSKLQFNNFGKASLVFILLTSSISISLSYFGAPKFVEFATPAPELEDINEYKKLASIEADSITNFYETHIEKTNKRIESIHEKNSWKGKTTKAVRPLVIALEKGNKQHSDSLHKALSMIDVRVQVQTAKIEANNLKTLQKHKAFLKVFGVYAALVTLGIEVLILLSVFWCIYYRFRSFKELAEEKTIQEIKSKSTPKEPLIHKEEEHIDLPPPPPASEKKRQKKTNGLRECLNCKKPFTPRRSDQLYCKATIDEKGRDCKRAAFYKRRNIKKRR